MKKKVLLRLCFGVSLILNSCSSDESDPSSINLQADVDEISTLAESGSWSISRFIDSGNDDTSNFDGYLFAFNADGSLFADSQNDNVNGTWSISLEENNNDFVITDDCNSCTTSQLEDVLTGCPNWFVDKLERNDEDLEDSLSNYGFNFSADGTLTAQNGSTTFSGSWESNGSNNTISVIISLSSVSGIADTWNLHEIELENGESKVDLRIGGDDRLRFKNDCTLTNNTDSNNSNSDNSIDFNIFFAGPPNFNELSADWDIVSHTDSKIELVHSSSRGVGNDLLTFEKN